MSEIVVGQMVYHRRADGFAKVVGISGDVATIKYEWPWSSDAPTREVPIGELRDSLEVEVL